MTSGDTISYSTVLLSFPLIICLLFNYKVKYMQLKFNLLISIFSIGIMLSMSQKLTTPYTWWGWTDESISEQTNYTINIDELKGFRVDKRTKVILEEVTKLITNNSSSNDFVFTFPHIKFFNILSHRYNMPTFTSNYFFDTCSDYYAIQDYNILKENYPDIIVWCDLGEDCWNIHEDKFRNGNKMGQRKIQDWFENVKESDYTLIGTAYNVSVYKLNGNDTPIKYTYFNYENDIVPQLSEYDINDTSFSILLPLLEKIAIPSEMFFIIYIIFTLILIALNIVVIKSKSALWEKFFIVLSSILLIFRVYPAIIFIFIIPLYYKFYSELQGRNFYDIRNVINMIFLGLPLISLFLIYTDFWKYGQYLQAGGILIGTTYIILKILIKRLLKIKILK